MTDKELAQKIVDAARTLAQAMNQAADAGLMIELEMKPHSSVADTKRVYQLGDYHPIVRVTRTIDMLASQ